MQLYLVEFLRHLQVFEVAVRYEEPMLRSLSDLPSGRMLELDVASNVVYSAVGVLLSTGDVGFPGVEISNINGASLSVERRTYTFAGRVR